MLPQHFTPPSLSLCPGDSLPLGGVVGANSPGSSYQSDPVERVPSSSSVAVIISPGKTERLIRYAVDCHRSPVTITHTGLFFSSAVQLAGLHLQFMHLPHLCMIAVEMEEGGIEEILLNIESKRLATHNLLNATDLL